MCLEELKGEEKKGKPLHGLGGGKGGTSAGVWVLYNGCGRREFVRVREGTSGAKLGQVCQCLGRKENIQGRVDKGWRVG